MDWGSLIGLGTQLAASAEGNKKAGDLTDQQKKILLDLMAQTDAGNYPRLHADALEPSEAGNVQANPELRAAQLQALQKMQDIGNNQGLTLQDRAAEAEAMAPVARQNSAMRQRVLESLAQRGMGGSGAELTANLQGNQDAAERANQAGLATAANAQKRYYDSILGAGKMAGEMRGQDFDQQMQAAQARDIRNRYNNNQGFEAQQYNAKLPVGLLDAKIRAAGGAAGFFGNEAQNTRNQWAGYGQAGREAFRGSGGGGGGAGGGGSTASAAGPAATSSSGGADPWDNLQEASLYDYE